MSAVINTNMAAIRTHGIYNRNNTEMNSAMTRVATAQKVNSVRDNASDWSISEKIRERVRSLNQANQNVQNDTAMMKTASGALGNTIDILKTLKERAVNAANDSNTDEDRKKIQAEVDQFLTQIDKNADVKYNGKALIDGSTLKTENDTKSVLYSTTLTDPDAVLGSVTAWGFANNDKVSATWTLNGVTKNSTELTIDNVSSKKLSDVFGLVTDVTAKKVTAAGAIDTGNLLDEMGNDVKASAAGVALIANAAKEAGSVSSITFTVKDSTGAVKTAATDALNSFSLVQKGEAKKDGTPLTFQYGDEASLQFDITIGNMKSAGLGLTGLSVTSKANAKSAMTTIDDALTAALKEQTKLGSIESRLGYSADNLSTQIENLEASDSAIRDADMAKEMTSYMKWSVLAQASQYMLAQAGQNAFSVLNLLQA